MKKLSTYIWEHKFAYLFGVVALVIGVSLDMVAPLINRRLVDDVIVGGQLDQLGRLLLMILGIGLTRSVLFYARTYSYDVVSAKISTDMRSRLYRHIQSLSADFFDRNGTGELMARVKDDIDRIWEGLSYVGMLMLEVILHTSMALIFMYRLNPKMSIAPTAVMIIAASIAIVMERRLGAVYGEISEQNAKLNTTAEENLTGVRVVKSFAREKHEIKKFLTHNRRYKELNMKQSRVFIKYYPYLAIVSRVLPLIILLQGGYMVIQGEITLGTLAAFLDYSINIVWPLEMLGWLTNGMASAFASNKKIKKICAEKPTITEIEVPISVEPIKGKITFDNVSFQKEDQFEILKNVSFTIMPGQTVGIMGATGSGKSSLIHLLLRLYDVTDGAIYVDDVDIRHMYLHQLRGSIGEVMQDIFLFSDTVFENVRLGRRDIIDMRAVRTASRQAHADNFIEKMERQYDTVIGERGVGLSGGQKQRITIARALARQNPILILDDSTSALDMETEMMIQETLAEMPAVTKIIIGHRISAVCQADLILFLDKGEIAEHGNHAELMAANGLYYQTYLAQYSTQAKTPEASYAD
ncbi:MAG: ABC transporter ATP-binding protein/permease [Lachnospiraceae bacterium]|nr:ABC transporter ATP-binding protein/permease [Lachnospiraceae bacterium]